ncbi:MAG TPA: alpha/beta hydrolase, partial [Flavisolibacter sp.]|nr:alpha/beta hydrolase [Flavisolibacter sp.]
LKYRLPDDSIMQDKTIGPLQDAQRAVQYVRENRKQWDVNKNRIGILGFSAGGHLASTEGTHFEKALIPNPKGTSLRPDFMVLVYPVINLSDSLMHEGSRTRLLGKNPSQDMIRNYSNDLQVNRKTPPTFLVHAKDDKTVKVENSIRFYDALQRNKVPSMIYLFDKGGHGFGLKNPTSNIEWLDLVLSWMRSSGWMGDKYQQ